MPELPEVERVRLVLEPLLAGRTIVDVRIYRPVIAYPEPGLFCARLRGRKITALQRRGKFLTILLNDAQTFVIHLRMTGQLLVTPREAGTAPHTHVVIDLDDDRQLRFIDARRFGRMWLIAAGEDDVYTGMGKLGPEPDDRQLTARYLRKTLNGRKLCVKQALMDQTLIAGLGNIYADEALYDARIHPERGVATLSDAEWRRLRDSIREVLARAVMGNAVTAEEYLAGDGKDYRSKNELLVYGRTGQKCRRCGTEIAAKKIAGRTAHFCPRCQKLP